jgi:hypothetical protein
VSEPRPSIGSSAFSLIGLVGTTEGVEASLYRPSAPDELTNSRDPSSPITPRLPPSTSPSGQAVLYEADMLSLEELLNRHRVAYTILERVPSRSRLSRMAAERRVWIFLLALTFMWGMLTASALTSSAFLIHPATALFGCLAIIVLVVSLVVQSRSDRRD